jgi:hypothetical protein
MPSHDSQLNVRPPQLLNLRGKLGAAAVEQRDGISRSRPHDMDQMVRFRTTQRSMFSNNRFG